MLNEPVRVGSLQLKNRLVMPPMLTNLTEDGRVTRKMEGYYFERARYIRPGLIITEHSCISEQGRASAGQVSIASDETIAGHRMLTAAIHRGGSRCFVQLNHAGSAGIGACISASDVPVPAGKNGGAVPRAMTVAEIAEAETDFVLAADRAMRAGYDGVEIHCAHGYLLNEFYSPLTNRRKDAYGGTLEDRLRFLTETVQKVRYALGEKVPLAVRLGGADYMEGGSTEDDAVQACRILQDNGVDLLDISGGMCSFNRPGHTEAGWFSSMTEKIRKEVTVPVILTGGIQTPAQARRLLTEQKADLIGVGRAILQDAHWGENSR